MKSLVLVSLFIFLEVGRLQAYSASTFGYAQLSLLIKTEHLNSVEEVISHLPEEMRSSFTLMKESLSLQEGSPRFPRAILFTNDGHFICTFNGSPKQVGFDTLECVEFKFRSKTFEFHQIQFPAVTNKITEPIFSPLNMTADKKISCTMCHGSNPRPNWETYSMWPGAYGSHDDYFDYTYAKQLFKKHPQDPGGEAAFHPELKEEQIQFEDFKKHVPESLRYSALIFPEGSKYSPYLSGSHSKGDAFFRPNLRLSEVIKILNAKRDGKLLWEKGRARNYAFLMAVANCREDKTQPLFPLFFQKVKGSSIAYPSLNNRPDYSKMEYVRTSRAVLADIFEPQDWSPVFRGMDAVCKGCYLVPGGGKYPHQIGALDTDFVSTGAYPWTYDYTTGDESSMNTFVATETMKNLISGGDEDLKPYFGLRNALYYVYYKRHQLTVDRLNIQDAIGRALDLEKLKASCSLLSEKLNRSLEEIEP